MITKTLPELYAETGYPMPDDRPDRMYTMEWIGTSLIATNRSASVTIITTSKDFILRICRLSLQDQFNFVQMLTIGPIESVDNSAIVTGFGQPILVTLVEAKGEPEHDQFRLHIS